MPTERLLTRRDVQALVGVTTSTFYRWLRSGRLPAPLMIGPTSPRWRASEIDQWLDSLPRGKGRPTETSAA